jgi:succinyl-CoA synthetase alpha subunit
MATGYVIRKNQYYDSVFLMRVARTLSDEAGVQQCAVLMATDANKELLLELGFRAPEVTAASPNDLVVAIQAEDATLIDRLLGEMDARLTGGSKVDKSSIYRSIEDASLAYPQSNLVVISVPGAYAAREAHKALDQGKHVFLFSDNVPLDQEVELKQVAKARRRLVMGPDCGTSLIGGIGVGFANRVRQGPVGVVGASGTGIQEFTSLIHQAGSGISHAIGTGSHDLSDAVGGITTMMGMDILEADPSTQVITLISKPSGAKTLATLKERIQRCRKPIIGCLLGLDISLEWGSNFHQVKTIDQAVEQALTSTGSRQAAGNLHPAPADLAQMEKEVRRWLPEQRYLRGLFAGGSFCYQAQHILHSAGIPVYSNVPLDPRYRLENPEESLEHSLLDLGDDYFTRGKPHPMIDSRERSRRILKEAEDPEVAILLLDFVLGEISSLDPVGDLIGALKQTQGKAARRGGCLTVVASICGTDQDPQNLEKQRSILLEAGVFLLPSSALAARFCQLMLQRAGER